MSTEARDCAADDVQRARAAITALEAEIARLMAENACLDEALRAAKGQQSLPALRALGEALRKADNLRAEFDRLKARPDLANLESALANAIKQRDIARAEAGQFRQRLSKAQEAIGDMIKQRDEAKVDRDRRIQELQAVQREVHTALNCP